MPCARSNTLWVCEVYNPLSKAAWIKVGGPRLLERLLEDPTDRTGIAPVTAVEPSSLELAFLAKHNARGRRMSPF